MNAGIPLKLVRVEIQPPLARVTLDRPEKLNALNQALLRELAMALGQLYSQQEVRAVVLTGAGERAFAAGADITELTDLDPTAARRLSQRTSTTMLAIERFPVPWIAAINGYALGGGLELALACTLRIASDTAQLGQPEVKLGLIPGYGGTQRLPRLIGETAALEMILTGAPVTAAEALRLGLVNRVVPPAELLATAEALALKIAANAPLAVRYAREAVRAAGAGVSMETGLEQETSLFALSCATTDMKEGTRAFIEKRVPAFQGK